MTWKLSQVAEWTKAKLYGDPDLVIQKCVSLSNLCKEGITFIENPKKLKGLDLSSVGAIFVSLGTHVEGCAFLEVSSPKEAFNELLKRLYKPLFLEEGVHSTAVIYPGAVIDPTAKIGPYVVVGTNASIGPRCHVYPFCYVGDDCVLEEEVRLYPNVTLYSQVHLSKGAIVHGGTVIGADGFGYQWNGREHVKVPQVGGVKVGQSVEIGANTCIDRATCGDTLIGDGTKIDNLVQVAHNVCLGAFNIVCGQSGIAGSSKTGAGVIMGAQVGIKDQLELKSGVRLGARAGVLKSLEKGDYHGFPAIPVQESLHLMALERRLPELFERIKKLEKIIAESNLKG